MSCAGRSSHWGKGSEPLHRWRCHAVLLSTCSWQFGQSDNMTAPLDAVNLGGNSILNQKAGEPTGVAIPSSRIPVTCNMEHSYPRQRRRRQLRGCHYPAWLSRI